MESAFPDVRVPTQAPIEAFGGGESAAAASGATRKLAMDQAAFHQQHLEDALNTEVQANLSKLVDEETAQKVALSKVKGKDAMAASSKAIEDFGKFHEDLAKNTANPVVKRATLMHFQRTRANLSGWAQDYGNQQYQRYQDDTDHATVKSEMNAAIADGRPDRINQALANQQLALEGMGRRHGWDEKTTSLAVSEAKSGTHSGILASLLTSGNDMAAKQYFEANRTGFVGNDLINAQKDVQFGSYRGEAQRELARITSDVADAPAPGMLGDLTNLKTYRPVTEKETYAAVDKIADPKLQDMVRDRLREHWSDVKRINHDAELQDVKKASDIIEANPSLDAIPVPLYQRLPMAARASIARRIKQIKGGEDAVTDKGLYYELNRQAENPETKKDFLKRDLYGLKDRLSTEDWKHFVKMQGDKLGEDPKAMTTLSFHDRIKDSLIRNKIFVPEEKDRSDDDKRRWGAFELEADRQIKIIEAREKRAAKPEEAQQVIDDLIKRKVEVAEIWSNPMRPAGIILPEERIALPEVKRAELTAYLKSMNKSVSGEKLQRMWEAMNRGDRTLFSKIAGE